MKINLKVTSLLLLVTLGGFSQEQTFLTDYDLSVCKGELPKEFSQDIIEKTENDVANSEFELSTSKKNEFYENSNYYIYNFLNGGRVLFGDEMSIYVNQVANLLLEKSGNSELKNELKFYVLKSNVVNAVCMPDGSIFVTVGLLSQIESEAQLAFVLAHEISHYTLQHGIKTYANNEELKKQYNRSQIGYDQAVTDLSDYSKDQELESDSEGYKMFVKAGYSSDEALKMLLVLQYSHLPFDEVKFNPEFFNKGRYKIPENYFEDESLTGDIEDNSDEDDSKSTHPNIKTRIDNLNIEIFDSKNNKGIIEYGVDNKFEYIQDKARFETQHLNILNRRFIKTIFECYLLKSKFPNNKFLDECIAISLYALSKTKTTSNNIFKDTDLIDGNSKELATFFQDKMDKKELNVLALKTMLELNDSTYKPYQLDLTMDLIKSNGLRYKSFYIEENEQALDTILENDSVITKVKEVPTFKILTEEEYADLTKVGKIKYNRAKQKHLAMQVDTSQNLVNETSEKKDDNYYKFAFYDMESDKELKQLFEEANEKDAHKYFDDLSYSEQSLIKQENQKKALKSEKVQVDSVIIINTNYEIYDKRGDFDAKTSFTMEKILNSNLKEYCSNSDVNFLDLSTSNLSNQSIDYINASYIISEWKDEMNESYDEKMLPLTQNRVNEVFKKIGYSNVMAFGVYNEYQPILYSQLIMARWIPLISLVVAPGVWPLHIVRFNKYNTTKYVHIMDGEGYNVMYREFESNKGVNSKQDEIFIEYIMNQITTENVK